MVRRYSTQASGRSFQIGSRLTVLAIAVHVLACSKPEPAKETTPTPATTVATQPGRGNRLVIGLQQEPDKLNSVLNAMVYGTYINQTIYGYFVKYDNKMKLIPDVITEIPTMANGGIAADGLTYTYHLRTDVRWHDGVPFTSADIKFSTEAILNTEHEVESRQGFDKVKSVEIPDEHTVIFHLKEPYVRFVEDTFFDEGIMPKHLLESAVGPNFTSAPFHRAPVGLGPYKFKEWVTGSHVTVVRNEDYFRKKGADGHEPASSTAHPVEEITFRFIPDSNALLVALRAGEIDGYDNAGTDQYTQLKQMEWIRTSVTPLLMWEHLDMNTEDPILKDSAVRRAIQHSIDRLQISREVYHGLWPPAYGDVSEKLNGEEGKPDWFNSEVKDLVRFDQEEASRILDEAGWKVAPDGIRAKGGQRLEVKIGTTAGRRQRELTEQVLQQQLRNVGIELKIENHNATTFFAPYEQNGVLKRGRFQLAMFAWISSPDPDRYTLYHSSQVPPPAGQNNPRYKNKKLDQLIERGLRTHDEAERKKIYDETQRIIATDVPMTPLVWRADVDPMTTRLLSFKPNPTQTGDTWNAWEWEVTN